MRVGPTIATAIAAWLCAACVDLTPYQCERDEDCRASGRAGFCEDVGYCSYADDDCESNRRFSSLAGPYAHRCTEPATLGGPESSDGTSSDGSSGTTDDDTTGIADQGPPRDEGPSMVCGNGELESHLGEECDDGNLFDGDGCNADCTRGGAIIWLQEFGADGAEDRFRGVDNVPAPMGGREGIVATGSFGGQVVTIRFDVEDRTVLWQVPPAAETFSGEGRGVVLTPGGRVTTALHETDMTGSHVGIECYNLGDGSGCGSGRATVASLELARGQAVRDSGGGARILVSGQGEVMKGENVGGAAEFEGDGDVSWETSIAGSTAMEGAAVIGQDSYVAGRVAGRAWLGQINGGNSSELWRDMAKGFSSRSQALLALDSSLIVAGAANDGSLTLPFAARIELDGSEAWRWIDPKTPGEIEALTVDETGHVVAGGFLKTGGTDEGDLQMWLIKWLPDLSEVAWSRLYAEESGFHGVVRGVTPLANDDIIFVGEVGEGAEQNAVIARVSP